MSDNKHEHPTLPPAPVTHNADTWNSDELSPPRQASELFAEAARRRVASVQPSRGESPFTTTPPPELEDAAVDSVRPGPTSARPETSRMASGIEAIVHPSEIQAFQRDLGQGRKGPKLFAYGAAILLGIAVLTAIVSTLLGP